MKTEEPKEDASTSKHKKTEPSFELRPNFSRVTPAQLPYISFPSDGRYQPVRAVSAKAPPTKAGKAPVNGNSAVLEVGSEKYAGGGGILILTDLRPNEEAEFIELQTVPAAPAPEAAPAGPTPVGSQPAPTGRHIALDENAPEAEPPEAFEYPFDNDT
ncbi:hypothetical protein CVT26_010352 [Gymnopilus dilepis]|uniref:26S proteasome regulatory subunit RPN2 C-terminal domain-containing protein n=1 Tax=Gymnopilus dilepis TaxID=231916 RepID=A0A409W4W3_9AGAR|nr:hypothetical protein CVT26_010352 [Gymnopilus dilepis]